MANGPESPVNWAQFDRELAHLREESAHIRELVNERDRGQQQALSIATQETQRRLHELNGAHEQAMENWRTSLPRELFDSYKAEQAKWRETIGLELIKIQTIAEEKARSNQRLIAVIGILLVILNIGLKFIGIGK